MFTLVETFLSTVRHNGFRQNISIHTFKCYTTDCYIRGKFILIFVAGDRELNLQGMNLIATEFILVC